MGCILKTDMRIILILLHVSGLDALACYSCHSVKYVEQCRHIVNCGPGNKCYYNQLFESGIKVWELGCMREVQCAALEHYLGISPVHRPLGCCDDTDLCNRLHANISTTNAHVSTTTGPRTTTHQPKIVINAPDQAVYQSTVQLSCVTIPPAEKYSWTFNGTTTLPSSVTTVQYTPTTDARAGTDVLTILKIDLTSFGSYTCTGTIHGILVSASHFIHIMPETVPVGLIG
ncbi:uncharacterized protein LOC132728099 [Ruditapes philippinarum]|uniref:uncharacterized protein LOC132728099 n=1 Tax=Ruditapes philippinarum TaxID=129788 RepID=UPI00295BB2C2|nr:uncharacterized protein LOC132728099 [Ruditapes philippinarum]